MGGYKRFPNEVGGGETTSPEQVPAQTRELLAAYSAAPARSLEGIVDFHVRFERIHPFGDGNGRIGRLILFNKCLKWNVVPFIIEDDLKLYYYRGLAEWDRRLSDGHLPDGAGSLQEASELLPAQILTPFVFQSKASPNLPYFLRSDFERRRCYGGI